METLSDLSMELAKISLEVTRQTSEKKSQFSLREVALKADATYATMERGKKEHWLQDKLKVLRDELESWSLTNTFLTEIRGAVNDRIQLFKRLDSDLRLQHKILEARIAAGLSSPAAPSKGGGSPGFEELDL
jgi:hypothetical protein